MKLLNITVLLFVQSYLANAQNWIEGEIHMKTADTFSGQVDMSNNYIASLIATYDIDTIYYPFMGLGNDTLEQTCRIKFSNYVLASQFLTALQALPICDYAELSPLYNNNFTPNDINANQWHLQKIQATGAWDVSKGNTNIVIAIIDNGVLTTHEDLAANIWVNTAEIPNNGFDDDFNGYVDDVNGFDVADRDNNPNPPAGISNTDKFNHGTHCAGIASAVTNNGKGIASVGFNTKIMPVKCTKNTESGSVLSASLDGITYAMRNNADIISMSFGSSSSSFTTEVLLNTARNRGIVLIGAAGNENVSAPFFPAAYSSVMSVGATNENDQKASFSNVGSTLDIMAPGANIFSTLASGNTDYGFLSGTSMACPLVAGLAALVIAAQPAFSPQQVVAHLKSNTDNISSQNPSFNNQLGSGRINASKALDDFGTVNNIVFFENKDLKIYPNPFGEYIYFEGEATENFEVFITDMNGKLLIHSEEKMVATTTLASGIYFLKVHTSNQKVYCTKLVKI